MLHVVNKLDSYFNEVHTISYSLCLLSEYSFLRRVTNEIEKPMKLKELDGPNTHISRSRKPEMWAR
jgi:hypothetical protein